MEHNREQIRYKMSEKQIKTALVCLSKPNSSPVDREKCYFMWKEPSCLSCYHEVAQNALTLIRELTEENERLRDELDRTEKALIVTDKAHNALFTESFRIEAEARAATVRKMQERLKEGLEHYPQRCGDCFKEKVDQIAKEMLEENDDR